MRHPRGNTHQYRQFVLFGKVERIGHHVVGFLLRRRFQHRRECEFAVKAGVLFVLRRVHRRVVGHEDDQSAVGAGYGRVDESVGGYVQAHVLHADERPLADVRDAQSGFHRRFFVGAPPAMPAAQRGQFRGLDIFGDLRRGSSRVGVHAGNPGMNGSQCDGLVTQQQ